MNKNVLPTSSVVQRRDEAPSFGDVEPFAFAPSPLAAATGRLCKETNK